MPNLCAALRLISFASCLHDYVRQAEGISNTITLIWNNVDNYEKSLAWTVLHQKRRVLSYLIFVYVYMYGHRDGADAVETH